MWLNVSRKTLAVGRSVGCCAPTFVSFGAAGCSGLAALVHVGGVTQGPPHLPGAALAKAAF